MGLDSGILTPRLLGLMALTGRRPAEIFFSAKFSLPPKKLPYPALIFDGQLKTRQAPGTSFEPYLIPVLGDPKKLNTDPGHKLLPGAAALSVGQSYKDFFVVES
jgi:hypothetical protein